MLTRYSVQYEVQRVGQAWKTCTAVIDAHTHEEANSIMASNLRVWESARQNFDWELLPNNVRPMYLLWDDDHAQ